MRTRNIQVFVAPGDEEAELPVAPSPWHRRRWVQIPYEHWALILKFAKSIDARKAEVLEKFSHVGASRVASQSLSELRTMEAFLRELSSLLPAASPLVEAPTENIPEDYPNEEHARMCDAVVAVMAAAAETGGAIRSWVE